MEYNPWPKFGVMWFEAETVEKLAMEMHDWISHESPKVHCVGISHAFDGKKFSGLMAWRQDG